MPSSPVLTDTRFQAQMPHDANGAAMPVQGATMTVGGTLTATGVLFALILASGWFGWSQVVQTTQLVVDKFNNPVLDAAGQQTYQNSTSMPSWLILAMFVGLGVGLVTAFKPKIARITAPIYALAYGMVLGAISAVYNQSYNGIVVQAVGATLGVFFIMFVLYATRIVKVTPKFALTVICATGGIAMMYFVTWIAQLFGADLAFWDHPTPLGIGISIVVVIVAALNLALDFNFIEKASQQGAPKYMEWYGAFGVTVTIVWLYLEILRLLSLLRQS